MNTNELKFRFGQKYQMPESLIDEAMLPLLISIEDIEKKIAIQLNENSITNNNLAEKIKGSITTINYENPKIALWGNIGKTLWIPISLIGIGLIVWGFNWAESTKDKYKAYQKLERISPVIIYDKKEDSFFIKKENFTRVGDIVIIKK